MFFVFFNLFGDEGFNHLEAVVFQLAPEARSCATCCDQGWVTWSTVPAGHANSLWPLWLEDLDLGKLPLQRVEPLRVFPRVHSFNRSCVDYVAGLFLGASDRVINKAEFLLSWNLPSRREK